MYRKFLSIMVLLFMIFTSGAASSLPNYHPSKKAQQLRLPNIKGRFNASSCGSICVAVGYRENEGKQYPLLVKSVDGGETFKVDSTVDYATTGALLTVSCIGSECIVGGYLGDNKENATPLLIESLDGQSWDRIDSILFKYGLIKKVSCNGKCIAVGWGNDEKSPIMHPMLAQQVGYSWKPVVVSNLPPEVEGQLYAASCTGYEQVRHTDNTVCVAIGDHAPYNAHIPLLLQTNDGGRTWISKSYAFNSALYLNFNDVNCTGSKNTTLCTIVGNIGTKDPLFNPVIYQTKDRGNNWIRNSLARFPTYWNGKSDSISCTGDSNRFLCTAVGTGSLKPEHMKQSNAFPIILFSENNDDWLSSSIYNSTLDWRTLHSTTCTSINSNFCFAVGSAGSGEAERPVLAVSSTNPTHWQAKQVTNMPTRGILRSTACTYDNETCIAVGYSHGDQDEPLLVASSDRGKSWAKQPILPVQPPKNIYYSCDPKSNHCVGIEKSGTYPVYSAYYSDDAGITWSASTTGRPWGMYYWFNAFACSSDVKNCVAVGASGDNLKMAVGLRTENGGTSWKVDYYTGPCNGPDQNSQLKSLTCDESKLNCQACGFCIGSGQETINFCTAV